MNNLLKAFQELIEASKIQQAMLKDYKKYLDKTIKRLDEKIRELEKYKKGRR